MKKNYTEEIINIGAQTLERLNSLGIMPYPQHYNDTFLDILENSKNIDIEYIKSKYSNLFCCPIEYQESTNETIKIAKKSIQEFEASNKNLRKISNEKGIELSEIDVIHEPLGVKTIQTLFSNFITSIESQLNISDNVLRQMREKIDIFEKNANINPVTKIYNHIIFKNSLEKILAFGEEKELDVFVIIVDADNFTQLNSQYGRVAGNKTIIYLSRTLQDSLRGHTKIFHTKGTQFSIILNRLTSDEAHNALDRIVKEIAHSKLFYKGNNISLTISAGMTKHKQNDTHETITKRAEEALELAKENGKNCYKEVY